jgi:hypothetical protein
LDNRTFSPEDALSSLLFDDAFLPARMSEQHEANIVFLLVVLLARIRKRGARWSIDRSEKRVLLLL